MEFSRFRCLNNVFKVQPCRRRPSFSILKQLPLSGALYGLTCLSHQNVMLFLVMVLPLLRDPGLRRLL